MLFESAGCFLPTNPTNILRVNSASSLDWNVHCRAPKGECLNIDIMFSFGPLSGFRHSASSPKPHSAVITPVG